MPDSSPEQVQAGPAPEALLEERRKGFRHGMSSALCLTAGLAAWGSISATKFEMPKIREIFAQIKVELPVVTLLVLDHSGFASGLLAAGVAVCVLATWRKGDRWATLWLNLASILLSMGWFALVNFAILASILGLMGGIAPGR